MANYVRVLLLIVTWKLIEFIIYLVCTLELDLAI